jgi:outer membrane protein assembly factor BamB
MKGAIASLAGRACEAAAANGRRGALLILAVSASMTAGSLPSASAATAGSELWVARYDAAAHVDVANALGVSPDGSAVFVTGFSDGSTGYAYATAAYDASSGSKLWTKRYDGPGNGTDYAHALGVSPDGSAVFVTGSSHGPGSNWDYATVAYDLATGATLWTRRYDGPATEYRRDVANALGVSPDGSAVFVTGYSHGSTGGDDYATVAYDAKTGVRLWTKRYDGPAHEHDIANALGVSPDGSAVFVTGSSPGRRYYDDYLTVAYDAGTGATLWTKRYDGPAQINPADAAEALAVSPDGSAVFVTGSSRGPGSSWDYGTIAYDAKTGARLWTKRYDGPANRTDHAFALEVSPDGSAMFVTGGSNESTRAYDYATVAYDASTGSKLWATRYDGPADRSVAAYAIGVSPVGSAVFVTGGGAPGSRYYSDYATVAYDAATGAEVWATGYDGPASGDDDALALALGVSPVGSAVFVTGRSAVGSTGDVDFATVAYAA